MRYLQRNIIKFAFLFREVCFCASMVAFVCIVRFYLKYYVCTYTTKLRLRGESAFEFAANVHCANILGIWVEYSYNNLPYLW